MLLMLDIDLNFDRSDFLHGYIFHCTVALDLQEFACAYFLFGSKYLLRGSEWVYASIGSVFRLENLDFLLALV